MIAVNQDELVWWCTACGCKYGPRVRFALATREFTCGLALAASETEDRCLAMTHFECASALLKDSVSSLDHHGGARTLGYQKKKKKTTIFPLREKMFCGVSPRITLHSSDFSSLIGLIFSLILTSKIRGQNIFHK